MRTYTPVQRRKDWIGVNINPNVTPGGFCAKQKKMTMLELKHACREGASQHPLPNPFELAQSLPGADKAGEVARAGKAEQLR